VNLATLLGVLGAFTSLAVAIIACGGSINSYLDAPSLIEVIVGSYFCTMCSTTLANSIGIFKLIGKSFSVPNFHLEQIVQQMATFSNKARQEGLLALEELIGDVDNEFLKSGMQLAVDGTDAAIIEEMLFLEIDKMQQRHKERIATIMQWGACAPAVGMLGTVIGLVAMMKNLDDKASVGPNMAMALITTLYGAIVTHFFCTPMSVKLRNFDAQEAESMEMIVEGILSIQRGDNPRVMIKKLLTYLPPSKRKSLETELLKD
jgi:chemotaxis protein MotA